MLWPWPFCSIKIFDFYEKKPRNSELPLRCLPLPLPDWLVGVGCLSRHHHAPTHFHSFCGMYEFSSHSFFITNISFLSKNHFSFPHMNPTYNFLCPSNLELPPLITSCCSFTKLRFSHPVSSPVLFTYPCPQYVRTKRFIMKNKQINALF